MATPIAELAPDLPDRSQRYINALVSLVWPYSSSHETFSLLLAEPDFRLRRSKGQVRAHFFGSSAKALAESHVGIGDSVKLSLHGSGFIQNVDDVATPGKCVDRDLQYGKILDAEISQVGLERVHIHVNSPEPTDSALGDNLPSNDPNALTQGTPYNKDSSMSLGNPPNLFASPAFLRGKRISSGPFTSAIPDPFVEDDGYIFGQGRKRPKLARDSHSWVFTERTPSPGTNLTDYESTLGTAGEGTEEQLSEEGPRTPSPRSDEVLDHEVIQTRVVDDGRAREHQRSRSPGSVVSLVQTTTPPSMGPAPFPMSDKSSQQVFDEVVTPRLVPLASPGLPLVSPLIARSGPASGSYFPENVIDRSELDISGDSIDHTPNQSLPTSPSQGSQFDSDSDNDRQAQVVYPAIGDIVETETFSTDEDYVATQLTEKDQETFDLQLTTSENSSINERLTVPVRQDAHGPGHEQGSGYELQHFPPGSDVQVRESIPSFNSSVFSTSANPLEAYTTAIQTQSIDEPDTFDIYDPAMARREDLPADSNRELESPCNSREPEEPRSKATIDFLQGGQTPSEEDTNVTSSGIGNGPAQQRETLLPPSQTPSLAVDIKSPKSFPLHNSYWRDKLDVKAVECKEQDLQLSPPPFPFVQNWDGISNQAFTQRRRSYPYVTTKSRRIDRYGGDGPSSDFGEEFHAVESDVELRGGNYFDLFEEGNDFPAASDRDDHTPLDNFLAPARSTLIHPSETKGGALAASDADPETPKSESGASTSHEHAEALPPENAGYDDLDSRNDGGLDSETNSLPHGKRNNIPAQRAQSNELAPRSLEDTHIQKDGIRRSESVLSLPGWEGRGDSLQSKDFGTWPDRGSVTSLLASDAKVKQATSDAKGITPDNSQATTSVESQTHLPITDNAALLTPQHTQSSTDLQEIVAHVEDSKAKGVERQTDQPNMRRSPRLLRRPPILDSAATSTAWSRHHRLGQVKAGDIGSNELETNLPRIAKTDEDTEEDTINVEPVQTTRPSLMKGLRTRHGYFTTLSSLSSYFNQEVDVLVVATSQSTSPKRATAGPRDYYSTLHVVDPSTKTTNVSVHIFRPNKTALPTLGRGQTVLLRNFKVQRKKGAMELLSTESSAWATFKSLQKMQAEASNVVKENITISGPPVEFGEAEAQRAQDLMTWWEVEGQFHFGSTHGADLRTTGSREKPTDSDAPQLSDDHPGEDKPMEDVKSPQQHNAARKLKVHTSLDAPLQHELRDGTRYFDPSPRSPIPTLHELRDGTRWFDFTGGSSRPGSQSSADYH